MNSIDNPHISVGLPVYNGEEYVSQAIDSILMQSYTDLELIISDNGSKDRTSVICKEYAAKDCRVRYYRSDVNRGGAWNFNRVVELSRGTYFKWMSHDDTCRTSFLEECLRVMEKNKDIVLCFTNWADIDDKNNEISKIKSRLMLKTNERHKLFLEILDMRNDLFEQFGLIRMDVLKKTKLILPFSDSDRVLMCDLALRGDFFEIPDYLHYRRRHKDSSKQQFSDRIEKRIWYDPLSADKIVFPYWRQLFEYCKVVYFSPIALTDKCRCYIYLSKWVLKFARPLRRDVWMAIKAILIRYMPWTQWVWHHLVKPLVIRRLNRY